MRAKMAEGVIPGLVINNLKSFDKQVRGPSSWLLRKLAEHGLFFIFVHIAMADTFQVICGPR
jgi:hypothetical protein